MSATALTQTRITLETLRGMKAAGRKIAMLTAYDYPTAALAQAAGVHGLLIGDSLSTVILGHESTRSAPFELMVILAEAVRRGAPNVFFIGDMPYEVVAAGEDRMLAAALRYRDEAGCDAVKIEVQPEQEHLVRRLAQAGVPTIAHLGLLPQQVMTPDGYRAQARDWVGIDHLVEVARRMVSAGAAMLLLEAVPAEAGQAVCEATDVVVIGCGAGPACDGHILVTQDMLGLGPERTPRFVPKLASLKETMLGAMRRYVDDIVARAYPGPEHTYGMRAGEGGK